MKLLQLLPVGNLPGGLLQGLPQAMADTFRVPCEVVSRSLNPGFALHGERQQYHSSEILQHMQSHVYPDSWRVLGIATVDLYIPILTFVFGEAQIGGPCAVVSTHRLRQEFRSEEHTSELQSHSDLVCRLLLEKKKKINRIKKQQQIPVHSLKT